jgi:hypothetical protein
VLASGALNRRCQVSVAEYVIADEESFVPVMLRLNLSTLRARETWLDTELACLTPLRPGVNFTVRTLKERPEVGRAWCEFYDASYMVPRGEGKYLGRYRKVTAAAKARGEDGRAECRLIVAGGPNLHRIRTFDSFATGAGRSRTHPDKDRLRFVELRNICDVGGRWDGMLPRDLKAETPAARRFLDDWAALYGDETLPSVEWMADYASGALGPMRGEPYLVISPFVFAETPTGWSSLIDSYHLDGLDGMRGVVANDTYFGAPPLWQFTRQGAFAVGRGTPLARVLPVPRWLLQSTFREVAPEDV